MLLHRRDGFCRLALGDGLGALATAWRLLGGRDHAAAELSLLFLLLAGVFLVPLLKRESRQRAEWVPAPVLPANPSLTGVTQARQLWALHLLWVAGGSLLPAPPNWDQTPPLPQTCWEG